jgi:hypothetical protein
MSLIFGNLTQDFVSFGNAINNLDPNNPETVSTLDHAASEFRRISAKDASYLTYIGASSITLLRLQIINLCVYRRGLIRLHIHLHVYLGLYLRGGC